MKFQLDGFEQELAIFGVILIAVFSLFTLQDGSAKDIVLASSSGLIGFITGKAAKNG